MDPIILDNNTSVNYINSTETVLILQHRVANDLPNVVLIPKDQIDRLIKYLLSVK